MSNFNLSDKIQPILSHKEPARSLTAIRTEDVREFIKKVKARHPFDEEIDKLAGDKLK